MLTLSSGIRGLLLGCCTAFSAMASQPHDDVAARVAKQNVLFEQYYQWVLRTNPEQATSLGDNRYNDQLEDVSLHGIMQRHVESDAFLKQLREISTQGMPEDDHIPHDLLAYMLLQSDQSFALKEYEMPVNQMFSPATDLADLPLSMPFDSVKNYED